MAVAPECVLAVPCYNEAERLRVAEFEAFVQSEPRVRLLFVNDGSTDATLPMLQAMAERYPVQIGVVDQQPNAGKAEAVRQGMLRAVEEGAQFAGFWDADLATPLDAVPRLLRKLEEDESLEMVLGARVRLLGRQIQRVPLRHYVGRGFATLASITLRLPIYDTQCGAKIFRVTPALRDVLQKPFLSRWIFDVEMLARFMEVECEVHGLQMDEATQRVCHRIYEYPLEKWEDIAGSRLKPKDFALSFLDLLRIRRRYLLND